MTGRLAVVFGGSGFIGRNVVRELAKRGWRVRAAVRRPHHAQFLRPMGVVGQIQLAQANLRYRASVAEAMKGADLVINLVGVLHQDGAQRFDALQHAGARLVAELAAEQGVPRLIHISAIGADADSDSGYARSKGEGERAVREAFPGATIMRPSIVFGPEDDFFNKFAGMFSMAPAFAPVPILIGGGETRFQPVYVDDVADAICAAAERAETAGRIYELGGPRIYTFRELMNMTLAEARMRRILVPLPWAVAPLFGLFGEIAGVLPFIDPPITRDQVRMLKKDNVVSAAEGVGTLADLGVAAQTVESILPTYMVRFRKYGQFNEAMA